MILDRSMFWYVHELLRRELKHKSHDADISAGGLHRPRRFRIAQRFELMDRQTFFLRGRPQRIRPSAFFLGRTEYSRNIVSAGEKRFEHGFAEILLSDDGDFHFVLLLRRPGEGSGLFLGGDFRIAPAQHFFQYFVGMLTQRG